MSYAVVLIKILGEVILITIWLFFWMLFMIDVLLFKYLPLLWLRLFYKQFKKSLDLQENRK